MKDKILEIDRFKVGIGHVVTWGFYTSICSIEYSSHVGILWIHLYRLALRACRLTNLTTDEAFPAKHTKCGFRETLWGYGQFVKTEQLKRGGHELQRAPNSSRLK